MAPSRLLTSPAAWSVSGVSSVPASLESWRRFTVWAVTLNGLVKPRLGSRRNIGIWPPSKPGLVPPPVRALWPLWPLPEVLPSPEPTPRPTRLRVRWEPGAGRRFDSEIFSVITFLFSRLGIGGWRLGKHPNPQAPGPRPHYAGVTSTRCLTLVIIPRTDALFGSSTVIWWRARPSARRVRRMVSA